MRGERVAVTGARGYLGGRLLQELSGAVPLDADVTSADALTRAFLTLGPVRAVIHLAAANEMVCAEDLARGFLVNAVGAHNVVSAAAAAGVRRVVFFSTFHVYGQPAEGAIISDDSVPDPRHPYGITKLAGEQLCKAAAHEHGLELAIVRLSNGVGVPAQSEIGRWSLLLLDLCRQAHEQRTLTLRSSGVQGRDFVSIDDIAAAVSILLSVEPAALWPATFNVGSGVTIRVRDVAAWVQEEYRTMYGEDIGLSAPAVSGTPAPVFRYDLSRLSALGFSPRTDLRAEIRKTLAFCERFRRGEHH